MPRALMTCKKIPSNREKTPASNSPCPPPVTGSSAWGPTTNSPKSAVRSAPSKLMPFTCKVCSPSGTPARSIGPANVPSSATVNAPRYTGSEKIQT